jgi:hypothetical protein
VALKMCPPDGTPGSVNAPSSVTLPALEVPMTSMDVPPASRCTNRHPRAASARATTAVGVERIPAFVMVTAVADGEKSMFTKRQLTPTYPRAHDEQSDRDQCPLTSSA